MRRWRDWGERLTNIMSPEFRDAVKGTRRVGAGIGTHEVVAGHVGNGIVAAEARELVPGGGQFCGPLNTGD